MSDRIIRGEPYKMVSTPGGMVAFGPFGKAKVDEKTYAWLEERVRKGRLSGVYPEKRAKASSKKAAAGEKAPAEKKAPSKKKAAAKE